MIKDPREKLMWFKYKFFEEGISPSEFRKCRMKDIREITEIKEAIDERMAREQRINEMMAKMKH